MEFIFERNTVERHDYYRIIKNEACECLKSLEMVVVGREYAENVAGNSSCGVFIQRTETFSNYGDEIENEYYYKINYCPICKKEIVIKVIEGEDCTEDHRKLRSERNKVHGEAIHCDSKKRTEELLKKRDELDIEINSYYDEELLLVPDQGEN